MTRLSLWLVVIGLIACADRRTAASAALEASPDTRPAVIFVPGYYGSTLRDAKTKSRVFLTASRVIFGSEALSLFSEELRTPGGPELEVGEVMRQVSIFPYLYSVDVYGEFLRDLEKLPGVQVVPFAYDWRGDLPTAAHQLDELVQRLRARGVRQIDIVAHSMGGLVTGYYLGYGGQELESADLDWRGARQVRRVAFFGVPFGGVFTTFRNMKRGAELAGNRSMFPAETVASYPATYQLISFLTGHLVKSTGEEVPVALEDPEFWQRHEMGLYKNKSLPAEVLRSRDHFVRAQLRRASTFARKIHYGASAEASPPRLAILNVMGEGRPTLVSAFVVAENQTERLVFDTDATEKYGLERGKLLRDGDGTVSRSSATVPEGLAPSTKVLTSKFPHEKLFLDPAVRQAYRDFLRP